MVLSKYSLSQALSLKLIMVEHHVCCKFCIKTMQLQRIAVAVAVFAQKVQVQLQLQQKLQF